MKQFFLIIFAVSCYYSHAQQNSLPELKPVAPGINTIVETVYNNSHRFMPDQRVYLMNIIKQNNAYDIRVALPPDTVAALKGKNYTLNGYFMYNGIVVIVLGEKGKLFDKTGDSISGAWLTEKTANDTAVVEEIPIWQFLYRDGKAESIENSTVNLFEK